MAVAVILGVCPIFAGLAVAQDPVKMAPRMNKVVLDNEKVRVLDVTLKTGEQMPMHQHPDNILYVIKGGKTKAVSMQGVPTEREFKDGECTFRTAETHAIQNTDTHDIHVINVELKEPKK
ncbi:MAG: cytoplasmic protein [Verrucomicrobiota bacterium]|nr:cytoplasmic protein [Verrucomicrobiota bacterium]